MPLYTLLGIHRLKYTPTLRITGLARRCENALYVPVESPLGGDDIGCSPPSPSSSSGQACGGDSCGFFSVTPSSATTMLFHHCSSSPSSNPKTSSLSLLLFRPRNLIYIIHQTHCSSTCFRFFLDSSHLDMLKRRKLYKSCTGHR